MDGSSFRRAQKSTRKGRLPNVFGKIGVNVAGGSADSGTTTQEGDRTTTQEGDRAAQQEGTTTQEDSDDGWIPQQKKKHQKMDYHEKNRSRFIQQLVGLAAAQRVAGLAAVAGLGQPPVFNRPACLE